MLSTRRPVGRRPPPLAPAAAAQLRAVWTGTVARPQELKTVRKAPSEDWRVLTSGQGAGKVWRWLDGAVPHHIARDEEVRTRSKRWVQRKRWWAESAPQPHQQTHVAERMLGAPPRPVVTGSASPRPPCLHQLCAADLAVRPAPAKRRQRPSFFAPSLRRRGPGALRRTHQVLRFRLLSVGYQNGALQATRVAAAYLGLPAGAVRPLGGVDWLGGAVERWAEARGISPLRLAALNRSGRGLRVWGIAPGAAAPTPPQRAHPGAPPPPGGALPSAFSTRRRTRQADRVRSAAQDPELPPPVAAMGAPAGPPRRLTCVLRAVQATPDELRGRLSRLAPAAAFPNYISTGLLGLGPAAGVFGLSTACSVQLGGHAISGQWDSFVRELLSEMRSVSVFLDEAYKEDLQDPKRPKKLFSTRFYGNVPEQYRWVRDCIDRLVQSGPHDAVTGMLPEHLLRFTFAAAARVWNAAAARRLRVDHARAVRGDLVADPATGAARPLAQGETLPIFAVVIPTISSGMQLTEWPESCGGASGLSELLGAAGIDPEALAAGAAQFLPPAGHRRLIAVAEEVQGRCWGPEPLTRRMAVGWPPRVARLPAAAERECYPQGQGRPRGVLFCGEGWACASCGRTNAATALRCRGCTEHRKHSLPQEDGADLGETVTAALSATIPADACPDAFLSEVFDLRYAVPTLQPAPVEALLRDSAAAAAALPERAAPRLGRRRAAGSAGSSSSGAPALPVYLQRHGRVEERVYTPPKELGAAGSWEIRTRDLTATA
eukprot:TRINITY_DN31180_c0_g1_i1.p1 TRINITY_DN31180_c0_g1~~TRINITY_DN31180_c0_g1_i1.p1  ORF type:complete len:801 (+),score=213.36 TRINITY_DN31180_c0_g1_i1:86-2404(+)